MKILITGIAGCGKSTIISELHKRGYHAIDLDTSGVCAWVNKKTNEITAYKEGAGKEWIENHRWQVIVPKLIELLETYPKNKFVYVGGKVARVQLGEMKDIFNSIYLLKPHDAVIDERLSKRTNNVVNFAKKKEEREAIIQNRHEFEKACLEHGAIALDNHGTVEEILEHIIKK